MPLFIPCFRESWSEIDALWDDFIINIVNSPSLSFAAWLGALNFYPPHPSLSLGERDAALKDLVAKIAGFVSPLGEFHCAGPGKMFKDLLCHCFCSVTTCPEPFRHPLLLSSSVLATSYFLIPQPLTSLTATLDTLQLQSRLPSGEKVGFSFMLFSLLTIQLRFPDCSSHLQGIFPLRLFPHIFSLMAFFLVRPGNFSHVWDVFELKESKLRGIWGWNPSLGRWDGIPKELWLPRDVSKARLEHLEGSRVWNGLNFNVPSCKLSFYLW